METLQQDKGRYKLGKITKSIIPLWMEYESLVAQEKTRRYNQGSVLHEYWFSKRKELVGWTYSAFLDHVNGLDKDQVGRDYEDDQRKYGDFSEWF